ncbi:MAG: hypothetical protein HC911_15885 [Chloroflexaceae bacterium]|nr:hypothetical protein [Chloroflexaceae bacterium]
MTVLYTPLLSNVNWQSLPATEITLPSGVHCVVHRPDGSSFSIRTMHASELGNLDAAGLLPQCAASLRKFASECFIFVIGNPKPTRAAVFAVACARAHQLGLAVLPVPDLESVPTLIELLTYPETAPNASQAEPLPCVDTTPLRAFGVPHSAASELLEHTGGRLALAIAALTDPAMLLPTPFQPHRLTVRALLALEQGECLAVDVLATRLEGTNAN